MSSAPLDGRTPLHIAAENGKTAKVEFLLDAGADPNAPDKNGSTPLHLAAWRGHADTIKTLIKGGADPNARNKYDWIPLHSASQNGCVDTIDILIDAGADLTAEEVDSRRTPLKIALQNKRWTAADLLMRAMGWMPLHIPNQHIGSAVVRLRAEANISQEQLARKSNIDENRISRIEMGKFQSNADVDRVVRALDMLMSPNAKAFRKYISRKWHHIEPPSFWNPERECLETTEETLEDIEKFLEQKDRPWQLRHQIERYRDLLVRKAVFLGRLDHNIAFIGDIGVGKSTAISFIFDLLVPPSSSKKSKKEKKSLDRTVLETGAGGTTICEVEIKSGLEIGIMLSPMSDADVRNLVSEFCAAKWFAHKNKGNDVGEKKNVGREQERAIRNMSGLLRKRLTVDGKPVYQDPVVDLVNSSRSERGLRTRILKLMNLEGRTRCELRCDRPTHQMEWIKETFRAINNGRLKHVPLPKSINLLIPHFRQAFGELNITVIDTKGVDDIAMREDIDRRLKDPRTVIVFCSLFNDAPGNSMRILLKHIREAFSEHIDNGKISLLTLPRPGEALEMKNDAGDPVESDNEGYDIKHIQILSEFEAENLNDVPVLFYNAEVDDAAAIRRGLFDHLSKMRKAVKDQMLDLCEASKYIIEKCVSNTDVDRMVRAFDMPKSPNAKAFRKYISRKWHHIEPPSFWNPERKCLETTEDTLEAIAKFIEQEDRPWPLRRLIERHRDRLVRSAIFLSRLDHNIAFIGDIGVGKSTAISFIFDLLVPPSSSKKGKKEKRKIDRPVLETGGGGTTICEVQIKNSLEVEIILSPMSDAEMRDLVSDFCAAKWSVNKNNVNEAGEKIIVSYQHERAIRNMSGLSRKRSVVDGKPAYQDPVVDLISISGSEEELRTRILKLMNLEGRTRCELRCDRPTRQMEWIKETFRDINNGRVKDVPLPKSINLLIPRFGKAFGELDITVINTKGIDDIAMREDIDRRLKDPRTVVVFCSRFNDAPGNSTRILLKHMRETFPGHTDNGKVSLLTLPRPGEVEIRVPDDVGYLVENDNEGYDIKRMQVLSEFESDNFNDVPMLFYNAEVDDAAAIRSSLFDQLSKVRKAVEERLLDLCVASKDIIEYHEAQAISAVIEEVYNRLSIFLRANRSLGACEQLAHVYAINTIKKMSYASMLWDSIRRKEDYMNLDVVHLIGVGAAQDANRRSESWFNGFDAFIKSLKADKDLELANRSIKLIAASAVASRKAFLEGVQREAVDVYKNPLSQASVWPVCEDEWGLGPGFRERVADHLEGWFYEKTDLKDRLERKINKSWDKVVIEPLAQIGNFA